jgi:hypothetical protein
MLTFFFKKTTVHIDIFTFFPGIIELFPIKDAEEMIPKWFKEVPTTVKSPSGSSVATVRTCPGMSELFKEGIIIPNWCDLYLNWSKGSLYTEPSDMTESHPDWQWNKSTVFNEYHHLKIGSPWKFKEKTGSKFMMTNAWWNKPGVKHFVPNGLLEFKYQHSANINMWIPKSGFPQDYTIPAGEPMCQLVNLDGKKIKFHMHYSNPTKFDKGVNDHIFSQVGQYYKRKKIIQETCPYWTPDTSN